MSDPFWLGVRATAQSIAARSLDVRVEGRDRVPSRGPALLVCRHYHHLYDGVALVLALPRPVRIVVALDWTSGAAQRLAMEALCALAGWPVVLREDGFRNPSGSGYQRSERRDRLRAALAQCTKLARNGELIAIFAQGFPAIDPLQGPGSGGGWLPLRTGYLGVARHLARAGIAVPIVPVGLGYEQAGERTAVTVRFGEPLTTAAVRDRGAFADGVERSVAALSR